MFATRTGSWVSEEFLAAVWLQESLPAGFAGRLHLRAPLSRPNTKLLCENIPTNMADKDVATKSPESDAPDDINIIPGDTSAQEGASIGVGYALKL